MRFEVPQFIDVEDKIFGPLTFKQSIYLAGGAGLGYVSYKLIPSPLSYLFALVFVILGALLAFYKINSRTFIEVAQAFLIYQLKGKLYIWKRSPKTTTVEKPKIPLPPKPGDVPKRFDDKTVNDLAQNLDILDH